MTAAEDKAVLRSLKRILQEAPTTLVSLAAQLDLKPRQVRRLLVRLRKRGQVQPPPAGRASPPLWRWVTKPRGPKEAAQAMSASDAEAAASEIVGKLQPADPALTLSFVTLVAEHGEVQARAAFEQAVALLRRVRAGPTPR